MVKLWKCSGNIAATLYILYVSSSPLYSLTFLNHTRIPISFCLRLLSSVLGLYSWYSAYFIHFYLYLIKKYNSSTGKISKGTITNYKIQVFFLFRAGSIKFLYLHILFPNRGTKAVSAHRKDLSLFCYNVENLCTMYIRTFMRIKINLAK